MKKKSRVAKTFYNQRALPTPAVEYWPQDSRELRELVLDSADAGAGRRDARPRVIVGDGQHLRPATIGERGFDVIRTENCARILSLDRDSGLVRVEAGMRWEALQLELAGRGFALDRYALHPARATLGGLLARRQPLPKSLFFGDLRDGCVAMSAVTPSCERYRYIPAPRKASGPDLRYLFIGGEGLFGAILDVTLVVSRAGPAHLYAVDAPTVAAAVEAARALFGRGIRPSFTHYDSTAGKLHVAVHASARRLHATERHLRLHLRADFEVAQDEAVQVFRQSREAVLLDRRASPAADRTLVIAASLHALGPTIEALGAAVEAVEIGEWNQQSAVASVRFTTPEAAAAALAGGGRAAVLDARAVRDARPVSWPQWTQTLKTRLDARRLLATGP